MCSLTCTITNQLLGHATLHAARTKKGMLTLRLNKKECSIDHFYIFILIVAVDFFNQKAKGTTESICHKKKDYFL